MKSRATHFLKTAAMALLISTVMVSCGKDNESGGKKRSSNPYGTYTYPGTSISGNGAGLPG